MRELDRIFPIQEPSWELQATRKQRSSLNYGGLCYEAGLISVQSARKPRTGIGGGSLWISFVTCRAKGM